MSQQRYNCCLQVRRQYDVQLQLELHSKKLTALAHTHWHTLAHWHTGTLAWLDRLVQSQTRIGPSLVSQCTRCTRLVCQSSRLGRKGGFSFSIRGPTGKLERCIVQSTTATVHICMQHQLLLPVCTMHLVQYFLVPCIMYDEVDMMYYGHRTFLLLCTCTMYKGTLYKVHRTMYIVHSTYVHRTRVQGKQYRQQSQQLPCARVRVCAHPYGYNAAHMLHMHQWTRNTPYLVLCTCTVYKYKVRVHSTLEYKV